jgi:hypothetical protein
MMGTVVIRRRVGKSRSKAGSGERVVGAALSVVIAWACEGFGVGVAVFLLLEASPVSLVPEQEMATRMVKVGSTTITLKILSLSFTSSG